MKEEGRRESLFKDLDFPAEDTSLFCGGSTPLVRLQGSITWLRPQVRPSALVWCVGGLCAFQKIAWIPGLRPSHLHHSVFIYQRGTFPVPTTHDRSFVLLCCESTDLRALMQNIKAKMQLA